MSDEGVRLGTVPELLRGLVDVIATRAWVALGLVPDPATHEVAADLDAARLAIDAAAALAALAGPRLSESERRDLQNLIATLRLNYVEQKGKQEQAGPEPPAGEPGI